MANLSNSSRSTVDSLLALKEEANRTIALTSKLLQGRRQRWHTPPNDCIPIPLLTLPLPEDMDHAFDDFKVSSEALNKLRQTYKDGIQQMQRLHLQKFEEACRGLCRIPQSKDSQPLPLILEDLRKVYESTYANRYLPMMQNHVLTLRSTYDSLCGPKKTKTPFNAECTTLLEKYFEFNAYPSAPDRKALAGKTRLTPRQIEVWFQNHRKRAKEGGKSLPRISPNMSHFFLSSLDKMVSSTPDSSVNSDDESEADLSEAATNKTSAEDTSVFSSAAPSYAFPTRFSTSNAHYHFHTDSAFSFPPPLWTRTPSSVPVRHTETKFDEFIAMFASKLSFRNVTSRKASNRKDLHHTRHSVPWFFATTTVASRSPHPAYVPRVAPRSSPSAMETLVYPSNCATSTPVLSRFPSSPSTFSHIKQTRASRKTLPFPLRRPTKCQTSPHVLPHGLSNFASTSSASRYSSNSSFSSAESSAPSSPDVQPQSDDSTVIITRDLQFLDEFLSGAPYLDIDHILPQSQFSYDLTLKEDIYVTNSLDYLDDTFSALPNNHLEAMS